MKEYLNLRIIRKRKPYEAWKSSRGSSSSSRKIDKKRKGKIHEILKNNKKKARKKPEKFISTQFFSRLFAIVVYFTDVYQIFFSTPFLVSVFIMFKVFSPFGGVKTTIASPRRIMAEQIY